jgi:hypothetical protein
MTTTKRAKTPAAASATTTAKAELQRLVDALPGGEVHAARRFLEFLRDAEATSAAPKRDDPVLRAFMDASEDDELLTPEEEVAIQEAEEEIARGEGIPWEQVRAELGLDKSDGGRADGVGPDCRATRKEGTGGRTAAGS